MSDLPRRQQQRTALFAPADAFDGDDVGDFEDALDDDALDQHGDGGWREDLRTRIAQHRGRIALGVLLLVSIYFLAAFGEQSLRIRELQAQSADLEAGNALVRADNDALAQKLAQWDAGGYLPYIEGRARRDLLLARPDEQVIAVRWHEPAVLTLPEQVTLPQYDAEPNWRRWLHVLTGQDTDAGAGAGTQDAESTP